MISDASRPRVPPARGHFQLVSSVVRHGTAYFGPPRLSPCQLPAVLNATETACLPGQVPDFVPWMVGAVVCDNMCSGARGRAPQQ
eukprot:7377947-Prymnesium_polylepis.2